MHLHVWLISNPVMGSNIAKIDRKTPAFQSNIQKNYGQIVGSAWKN